LQNPYLAGKESALKALDSLNIDIPDLSIIFSAYNYSLKHVINAIRATIGNKSLIASTTMGQIMDRNEKKYSVLVSLISSKGFHYAIQTMGGLSQNPYTTGHHLAWGLLDILGKKVKGMDIPRKALIVFCDNTTIIHSEFIKGLQEVLGLKFPIVGAISCRESIFRHGWQAVGEKIVSDSASGILLGGENLLVGIGSKHGWQPLGLPQKITRAIKNKIVAIGNMSPYQFYKKYLAENITLLENDPFMIFNIYPFGIAEEKGNYLLRIPTAINSDGSITLQTQINEGIEIRLMISYREQLLEATKEALEEALQPFKKYRISPQFILVFSSYVRKEILGIKLEQELAIIKRKLPETVKVFGFYTTGEFAPLIGGREIGTSYFQNSIVILTIGVIK
jgi:hypothetical protein